SPSRGLSPRGHDGSPPQEDRAWHAMRSHAGVRWPVHPGFCVFANVAATTPGTGDDNDTTSGAYRGGSERDSCVPTSPEWTAPVRARYRFLGLRHITRRRTDRESTFARETPVPHAFAE